ncbi:PhzF family phenazine biosynthesis protein [Clostridium sp. BJN0013]|uniref:PhzF family phenazine biosynthesis protein n=1 Tax=Clostridium sp. BJN0013 TaxID=3236840 RepID=UPI0034C60AF0
MKRIRINQVDTFTSKPMAGNPAGVVSNAAGLTDDEMHAIAREINLPATTFVFPPNDTKANFLVRYFTPCGEIAVGGHPTLATIHVLLEEGKIGRDCKQVWLETGGGILPIDISSADDGKYTITITMTTPKFESAAISHDTLAAMLGTDPGNLENYPICKMYTGLYYYVVGLKSLSAIKGLCPDFAAIAELSRKNWISGLQIFTTETDDPNCDFHVRTFLPVQGTNEDIVCGTGNSCIGAFVVENGIYKTDGYRILAAE